MGVKYAVFPVLFYLTIQRRSGRNQPFGCLHVNEFHFCLVAVLQLPSSTKIKRTSAIDKPPSSAYVSYSEELRHGPNQMTGTLGVETGKSPKFAQRKLLWSANIHDHEYWLRSSQARYWPTVSNFRMKAPTKFRHSGQPEHAWPFK